MYLDTHVVVWLYAKDAERISPRARELIEHHDLLLSPMVLLELEYLFKTGKTTAKALEIYDYLRETIQIEVCNKSFATVARRSIGIKWTRDPFDRLITAQAAIDESLLLTRDDTIHSHYPAAIW